MTKRVIRAVTAAAVVWLAFLAAWPAETLVLTAVAVAVAVWWNRRTDPRNRTGGHQPVTIDGREQIVYAFAGLDHFTGALECVKFGITVRGDEARRAEVDDREQTVSVRVLATGPGGRAREQQIHARLDEWRYPRSEWFHPAPEVLAAVGELERPTRLGRELAAGHVER